MFTNILFPTDGSPQSEKATNTALRLAQLHGARLIVTLLHAMQRRGLTRGVAALCIGGGEATAIAIERTP